MHKRGIALIGYMGTYKSSTGKCLAQLTGMPFADSDAECEAQMGMSIRAAFDTLGEGLFRDVEQRTIARLCAKGGSILSTGGGVPLRDENMRALQRHHHIVWLTASPETIAQRIAGDTSRPLAPQSAGQIASMMDARAPCYRAYAALSLPTDRATPAELAVSILRALGLSTEPTERED